ncbi:enoyl-CoA hydratase/isomerase family protein [Halorarius halobius]|uniref:enoyl-CoA hydratase/isomerase family protein n=1 Tax=Halorarius halobius TaxID=2962671 RepID=UPI0020CC4963|nr:enoyl-CoA hydratase-related protein [Halorarius halobius]
MSNNTLVLDVEDGVAELTLNRPDNYNALTADMSAAIVDAIDELEARDDVRCLVVTGTEGTFCAGGDINAMMEMLSGSAELHEAVERIQHETSRAVRRLYEFHLPTIAKIDGVAYGAGGNLALACDVLLASEDARISFGFRQVGLAVDTGTSYLLPRVVGENVAKELVFTGEQVDADRAADLGLFNHVYDADEFETEAAEFIEGVATGPTVALRTSKNVINQGFDASLKQAQDNEAAAQAAVFETHDHEEGATAFMEGRAPEFEGE